MNAIMKAAMDEMRKQLTGARFATGADVQAVARRVARQGYSFARAYQAANVAESALMKARRESR